MRFCMTHWQALRDGVEARGMSHLVAKSGEEAHAALTRQAQGDEEPADWDPLMQSYLALTRAVLEQAGLQALAEDFCPMCAVQESYEDACKLPELPDTRIVPAQTWIDSCLDAAQQHARKKNLIPGVQ